MAKVEVIGRMSALAAFLLAGALNTVSSGQPLAGQSTTSASPQTAINAGTVLANVQQYYAKTNQLTALFRHIVANVASNTTKTSDGTLWAAKPAQFRWDYMAKTAGHVSVTKSFIFDGQTFWLVDHGQKQIVQSSVQNSLHFAALSFLTAGSNLSSQFNVALDVTGTYGANGSIVLELTPKVNSTQYSKLFLVVDKSNWRVKESIVVDSSGDTNTFQFYVPDLNAPVEAQWFQINPSSMPTYNLIVPRAQAGSATVSPASATSGSPAHSGGPAASGTRP
jgi:outer membrane lipoprotein-sorting protein